MSICSIIRGYSTYFANDGKNWFGHNVDLRKSNAFVCLTESFHKIGDTFVACLLPGSSSAFGEYWSTKEISEIEKERRAVNKMVFIICVVLYVASVIVSHQLIAATETWFLLGIIFLVSVERTDEPWERRGYRYG